MSVSASAAPRSPIADAIDRLGRVEARLNRLLAAGARHAGDDPAELLREADDFAAIGLVELAARLRGVAEAAAPSERVRAGAAALAACRLVRARLAPDEPPPGSWTAVGGPGPRKAAAARLLPLARFALGDGEAWSCLWLKGGYATEWLLIEPPARVAPPAEGKAPPVPWLLRPVAGRLRWRARLPFGAGEVELCALDEAAWAKPPESGTPDHPLVVLLQQLKRGRLGEAAWLGAADLKALPLDSSDLDAYLWPDPAAPTALAAAAPRLAGVWMLASTAGGTTPLALLTPGSPPEKKGVAKLLPARHEPPRILHLVPGLPSDDLTEL